MTGPGLEPVTEYRDGPVRVEVNWTTAPDGRRLIRLQLPDGFVLVTAEGARWIAYALESTAAEEES